MCDKTVAGTVSQLGALHHLQTLFLYDMRLSGTIGMNGTDGNWAHWMYGNAKLSGTLPNWNSSYSWRTGNSRISGTLQLSFLQSPSLIQFDVNEMRLSGTFPENITAPGNKQPPCYNP